ncbi:hypothetical protein [Streptomyces avicenniae]|uniref:hypothetical protein n=1 Tax=Streptomyces avicenniae TaxID=500153 RepID=UPI00069A543F|nr:hypothetical protein [Streptomyces avicenniae]
MGDEHAELRLVGRELRRAAAEGVGGAGPAPVDALVRRGRQARARGRRRLAVGAAALAALVVPLGVTVAVQRDAPAVPAPAAAEGPRVVRPDVPTPIGENLVMALRDGDGPRYVVASPGTFASRMTAADYIPGTALAPDSVTLSVYRTKAGIAAVTGTWSAAAPPSRVTVTAGGRTYEADLLRLPDGGTWGAFYVTDVPPLTVGTLTATAYTTDDSPLAEATADAG